MPSVTPPPPPDPLLSKSETPWGTWVLAAILTMVAGAVWMGTSDLKAASDWVTHTQENRTRIENVVATIKEAESAQRGYLLTGDLKLLRRGLLAEENAVKASRLLRQALRNPEQQKRADELTTMIQSRVKTMDEVEKTYQRSGLQAAQVLVQAVNQEDLSQKIVDQANVLLTQEEAFLVQRRGKSERIAFILQTIAICGLLLTLTLVVLMGRSARREIRRRGLAMRQAEAVNLTLKQTVGRVEEDRKATQALAQFAGLLQGCPSVEEAFQVSAHSLARILPDTSGVLYLLRHSRDHAENMAEWGEERSVGPQQMGPQDCWALRQGRAFESSPTSLKCPHMRDQPSDWTTCVPLRAQGMDLGILAIQHAQDWDHLSMAEAAAEQLALAVANLRLRETLRTQSLRDALTGLPNRRELEEALPRETARALRTQEPLSLLVLDIDHFKRFNDTYGHEAGDTVLQAFGRLLQDTVRGEDLVVRLGGEEFVVLLPNTSSLQGTERADRMRARIAQMAVQHRGVALGAVSASIGLATYLEHTSDEQQLIGLADAALYRAKTGGRNRVETAVTPSAP